MIKRHKNMSVKERMSREKLMLAPSTEELPTIDRPIQVNGKSRKNMTENDFCAFPELGNPFQRRL